MTTRIPRADTAAILVLVALWLLFFWRLFTPVAGDQASLKQGDFSGQFVAFAAYQYQRFTQGEIPLWNPYNNGGLPFIADTQAAVFYPPRLLTIALARLSGGWSYHALELEMMAHVLFYTLTMYALVRRITRGQAGGVIGGLAAAVIAGYGGYLSGYPPLQLALLEAGVWLPLAVLGITEATRHQPMRWFWLALTGLALGLSWMAGHPQTSWFLAYLLLAYFAYRVYTLRAPWSRYGLGAALFGGLAFALAAVQLLPGLEYLPRTARVDFTYDAKGNGFPFRDLIQVILPGVVSLFSPLYVGVIGLALAGVAVWRHVYDSTFWGTAALVALLLSFGANSAVFPALYNLLPGLRFFRGQERAAYVFANSMAILAGLGVAHLAQWDREAWSTATKNLRRGVIALAFLCSGAAALIFAEWIKDTARHEAALNAAVLSTLIAFGVVFLVWQILKNPHAITLHALLIAMIAFELFSVNMDAASNYDPIPPTQQLSLTPPLLVAEILADSDTPFRVDGYRGLHDNFGSLYGVMDMRGISPLFLTGPFELIEPERINPLAWELFAVRYVFTDWQELPAASQIIASGQDRYGAVNLHRLDDPRPFAHLIYNAEVLDSDEFAYTLLRDANFNPRSTVILNRPPGIELPANPPDESGSADVTQFAPESFTVRVSTPENAILSLAHPDYPGWQAFIDGQPADILRAYGALSAVAVPTGEHEVRLAFDPLSYRIGVLLSLLTWVGLTLFVIILILNPSRNLARLASPQNTAQE